MTGDLFHFTCDHGRQQIGDTGTLLPASKLTDKQAPWPARYVWLTDMARPDRNALGLTSHTLNCDRIEHRYRVTDPTGVVPWHRVARLLSREQRDLLEAEPGARPMHWFVALRGIPVVYDPVPARALTG